MEVFGWSINLGMLIYNAWVWTLLIIVLIFLLFLGLWWNRHRKLIYPSVEIIDFGNGKIGLQRLSAGRFSKRKMLFGLIELPSEKRYETNDKREIQNASTEDCHDIFGKKGFILKRKDDDPKIIVPLSKVKIEDYELIASIAQGDFRDTGSRLMMEKEQEMKSGFLRAWEAIQPFVTSLIFIIALIFVINFASQQLSEARIFYKEVFGKPYVPSASP